MPQAKATKFVRSFVKGLVTEAGYLNYPEDASKDELNTLLHVRGNRSRRPGLDFEEDSTATTFTGFTDADITGEFFWRSVDNDASINFLVVQIANHVYFYDASVNPLSAGKVGYALDLNNYKSPTATLNDVSTTRCDFSIGKGFLFIVQEYCDPISLEYDKETATFSPIRIILQVRDFDGLNDQLSNDAEPSFLSDEHHYNLRNQGWVRSGTNSVQPNYPTEEGVNTPGTSPPDDTGSGAGAGSGGGGGGLGGGGYGGGAYNPFDGEFNLNNAGGNVE